MRMWSPDVPRSCSTSRRTRSVTEIKAVLSNLLPVSLLLSGSFKGGETPFICWGWDRRSLRICDALQTFHHFWSTNAAARRQRLWYPISFNPIRILIRNLISAAVIIRSTSLPEFLIVFTRFYLQENINSISVRLLAYRSFSSVVSEWVAYIFKEFRLLSEKYQKKTSL